MVFSEGIALKKQFGQHFLRDRMVVDHMIEAVELNDQRSVFEIGCGDGFLTRAILESSIARLWCFEIDPEWAEHIRSTVHDPRITVYLQNFLDIDPAMLESHAPWTILSNLPYQVTFPILHMFQRNRQLIKEGVVMVQEEVAQKITKSHGRGYGYPSLFFQHYFEWKMLDKISPAAFFPPPKVFSRLLYFKPRQSLPVIEREEEFWRFIQHAFKQPRRTLKNNLGHLHYPIDRLEPAVLQLRAQQMTMSDFLALWQKLA